MGCKRGIIDNDGTMTGYDINLIKTITESFSIPVIVSGGVGNYMHILQAIRDDSASAVAATGIFHFTQQSH